MNSDLFDALERCMLVFVDARFTPAEIADGMAMYSGIWRAKFDRTADAAGRINRVADFLRNCRSGNDADGFAS